MSAITPQTELRLIKCPIESDNRNQMTFASATAQYNYFNGLSHLEVDNFTYQRKDSTIRYPAHIDTILNYNYVMYKNENYTNKWFYAFITKMEYVNDNMTLITIHTDVYQTWMFQMVWKKSFIEREHVNSDEYAEHTIPENLETGEYITAYSFDSSDIGESHLVMGTTIDPRDGTSVVTGGNYGGIYSGVCYYVFQTVGDLTNALNKIASEGNSDSIVSLFYCPDWITDYDNTTFTNGIAEVRNHNEATKGSGIAVPLHPTIIDNYVPKNRKLFTWPYVAYLVSNNSGNSMTYRLEDFLQKEENGDYIGEFDIFGTCCPGASIRLIPKYYKTKNELLVEENNNEYGLTGGKLPIASWGNDLYTNWQTQNGVNIGGVKIDATTWQLAKSGVQTAVGIGQIAMGDVNGGMNAGSGIAGMFNALQEDYRHSFNSMEANGNTNSGDVTYSMGKLTFSGYFMTIKSEYAKIIDDYFSMYGYKVNSVKVPNITGRTNWNYVKTIGANIEGDIPEDHLNEIKSMFNNGVTLWHNASTYLDYSQSNTIVS